MNNQSDKTTFSIFVSDEKERLDKFQDWCFRFRPDESGHTAYQWRDQYQDWLYKLKIEHME